MCGRGRIRRIYGPQVNDSQLTQPRGSLVLSTLPTSLAIIGRNLRRWPRPLTAAPILTRLRRSGNNLLGVCPQAHSSLRFRPSLPDGTGCWEDNSEWKSMKSFSPSVS